MKRTKLDKSFGEMLKASFKSSDTEEWLDVYFTRPIGLAFAIFWARVGVSPNAITILSMFLGAGAGWMFAHTDPLHNICGIILMMFANFCDSTDGQLARLTNQKTVLGRMLDGFASDVWFACCYLAIIIRMWTTPVPFFGQWIGNWGILAFFFVAYASLHWHALQCSLADYYRQIHLYFVLGEEGSELNSYAAEQKLYDSLPWSRERFLDKLSHFFYKGYCRKQERQTPQFQKFFAKVKAKYPNAADMPQELREQFRAGSLPLMKYTNILTHNTRAFVMFAACLFDEPWLYPLFEMTILAAIYYYMRYRHEKLCTKIEV